MRRIVDFNCSRHQRTATSGIVGNGAADPLFLQNESVAQHRRVFSVVQRERGVVFSPNKTNNSVAAKWPAWPGGTPPISRGSNGNFETPASNGKSEDVTEFMGDDARLRGEVEKDPLGSHLAYADYGALGWPIPPSVR